MGQLRDRMEQDLKLKGVGPDSARVTNVDKTPGFIRAAISDSSGNDLDSHTVSSPEEEIHITVGPLPATASYRVYVISNITVTLSLNLSEPQLGKEKGTS